MRHLFLSLLLLAPLLTGCLGDDAEAPDETPAVAKDAEDAGALSGPAPSAPKQAYTAADPDAEGKTIVAHPVLVKTNPAKAPVSLDFSGEFKPGDCRPLNFGGVESVLMTVSNHRRIWDLADNLAVGDVFQYEIGLSFRNSADNWGEIHPMFAIGNTIVNHNDPVQEVEEVALNWTGQAYRASEDDLALLGLNCFYGVMKQAIPYTLTVKFTFADSAIPAEAPMLVPVPEGVTRMFVRGVALNPDQGVMSHFRIFDANDELVCECALGSNQEVATVSLPGPGDYVLLVDHTDNGFVSVAFDAPPEGEIQAMESEWVAYPVAKGDGAAIDQTVELDLPKVPLFMSAWVAPTADGLPGGGKKTSLAVTNGRGEVLRAAWGGHYAQRIDDQSAIWFGWWPADWEFFVDHHAYAPGAHVLHVKAEALRGEVILITRQYVR